MKRAITVLRENLVDDENKKLRQETALHILKGTGLLYAQSFKPYGPTTVSKMEEEEMNRQNLLNIFGSMKSQKLTRNG